MENNFLLSISLNTDLLETNIINIAILVAILFNVIGSALKAAMLERKEKILSGVKDAELRLNEATDRLNEAKSQLSQSKLIINKIKLDKETAKRNIALSNRDRALEDLKRQSNSTKLALTYKEQQVLREVKEQITTLALSRVITSLQDELTIDNHLNLINNSIALIGG